MTEQHKIYLGGRRSGKTTAIKMALAELKIAGYGIVEHPTMAGVTLIFETQGKADGWLKEYIKNA